MHQITARNAIRTALTQFFPELIDTTEGCAKIERSVWGVMKSIDDSGLRFVGSLDDDSQFSDFNGRDVSVPRRLVRLDS